MSPCVLMMAIFLESIRTNSEYDIRILLRFLWMVLFGLSGTMSYVPALASLRVEKEHHKNYSLMVGTFSPQKKTSENGF